MGLMLRLLSRYFAGALIGLLAYMGLPPEFIQMVREDPEFVALIALLITAVVEWATVIARRRGWLT